MEGNLRQARRGTNDPGIKNSLHSLEVDRVKYVLTAYIRERIQKIEQRPAFYLNVRLTK